MTSLVVPASLISTDPGSIGTLSLVLGSHSFTFGLALRLGSNVALVEEPSDDLTEYVSLLAWRAYTSVVTQPSVSSLIRYSHWGKRGLVASHFLKKVFQFLDDGILVIFGPGRFILFAR